MSLSLSSVRRSMQTAEILVAADGAVEDPRPLARDFGATVVSVDGPSGPATARNRAAAMASGDVLVFVDTDVVPAQDALPGMCRLLAERPDVAGVFGAYDLAPPELNFMSQFKNLSHSYVHEVGQGEASTFWAGLGAIRAPVFRAMGGFDERFRRPSIEDIELGYRVVGAGHTLLLDPSFRGTHLKRWTLGSVVSTDLWARGVPWTQLIHRSGAPKNQLNLSAGLRLSVVCAYLFVAALAAAVLTPWALVAAVAALAGLIAFNADFYAWLGRLRGAWFAVRAVPAHLVHHLCNGLSFVIGTLLFLASRLGIRLPGQLPASEWRNPAARPGARQGPHG